MFRILSTKMLSKWLHSVTENSFPVKDEHVLPLDLVVRDTDRIEYDEGLYARWSACRCLAPNRNFTNSAPGFTVFRRSHR